MFKNVFCIHADNPGGYCKNKNVKRSLFGLGARCCVKYRDEGKFCPYYEKPKKPRIKPPAGRTGEVKPEQIIRIKLET